MCRITKLHCLVCNKKEHFLFKPCEEFVENNVDANAKIIDGKRFYCHAFNWPLDPAADTSQDICVSCLERGRPYYQAQMAARRAEREHAQIKLKLDRLDAAEANQDERASVERDALDLRHLSPIYQNLPDHLKALILTIYDSERLDDLHWTLQSLSVAHRTVRVLMPRCPLCKQPTMRSEEDGGGIADVEIGLSSMLQDWLLRLQRNQLLQPGATNLQTDLRTQFIGKVCNECIKNEEKLRLAVREYLVTCNRFSAWSIYAWLLSRGIGNIPAHSHASLNLGYPDREPPNVMVIMALMADSWKRLTGGLAWEDTVDYSPPVTCPLLSLVHEKPLLTMDQWMGFATPRSDKPLGVRTATAGEITKRPFFEPENVNQSPSIVQDGVDIHQWSQSLTNTVSALNEELELFDENIAMEGDNIRAIVVHAKKVTTLAAKLKSEDSQPIRGDSQARKRSREQFGENGMDQAATNQEAAYAQETRNLQRDTWETIKARSFIRKIRKTKERGERRTAQHWDINSLVEVYGVDFEASGRPTKRRRVEPRNVVDLPIALRTASQKSPDSKSVNVAVKSGDAGKRASSDMAPGVVDTPSRPKYDLFGSDDSEDVAANDQPADGPSGNHHKLAVRDHDVEMEDMEIGENEALIVGCDQNCFHWIDSKGNQPGDLVFLPLGVDEGGN